MLNSVKRRKTKDDVYQGKIMLATNFKKSSKNALDYALALAKKLQTKIILLHSYQPLESDIDQQSKSLKIDAETKLNRLCEEIQSREIKCEFINLQGWADEVIKKQTDRIHPDLLIMGVEDLTKLEKIIFLIIREQVMESVDCNLLLVPKNSKYKAPKKIAFAIDFHSSDLNNIRFLCKLAENYSMNLHLVHIVTEDENLDLEKISFEDFKDDVQNINCGSNIVYKLLVRKGVTEELKKYVTHNHIDYLCIAKTSKGILDQLFFGSVSHKLAMDLDIPLFIFQAEDDFNDLF